LWYRRLTVGDLASTQSAELRAGKWGNRDGLNALIWVSSYVSRL